MSNFHLLFLFVLPPVTANIRALNSDPIRGLIAEMTKPPKALLPAPIAQKEPPTGYSYQQINCLDSIIRCVSVQILMPYITSVFVTLLIQQHVCLRAGTWTVATFPTQLRGSVAPPARPPVRLTRTSSWKPAATTKVLFNNYADSVWVVVLVLFVSHSDAVHVGGENTPKNAEHVFTAGFFFFICSSFFNFAFALQSFVHALCRSFNVLFQIYKYFFILFLSVELGRLLRLSSTTDRKRLVPASAQNTLTNFLSVVQLTSSVNHLLCPLWPWPQRQRV